MKQLTCGTALGALLLWVGAGCDDEFREPPGPEREDQLDQVRGADPLGVDEGQESRRELREQPGEAEPGDPQGEPPTGAAPGPDTQP